MFRYHGFPTRASRQRRLETRGTRDPSYERPRPAGTLPVHMEQSLKNRLTYGPLMLVGLFALLWLDYWIQARTVNWNQYRERGVAGVGLLVLLLIVLPVATRELATLFAAERVRPYRVISAAGS